MNSFDALLLSSLIVDSSHQSYNFIQRFTLHITDLNCNMCMQVANSLVQYKCKVNSLSVEKEDLQRLQCILQLWYGSDFHDHSKECSPLDFHLSKSTFPQWLFHLQMMQMINFQLQIQNNLNIRLSLDQTIHFSFPAPQ